MDVVLATASPRRRELMRRVCTDFRVHPVDVDESSVKEADPLEFAVKAAVLKARKAAPAYPSSTVIGADTVVAVGRRILGKPSDRDAARAMLRLLSGRRHRVITGIALYRKNRERLLTGCELTSVTFRELTAEMIEAYLDRDQYMDKAGAYAIQDIGDAFVRRLKGDFDNVVGFPVKKVRDLLARFELPLLSVTVEEALFPEPAGLAFLGGRKLLVPQAVVGDRAVVQIVGEGRGAATAEILKLETPSPFRVEAECPHFGACGGCRFQNVEYGKQLELKAGYLRRVLGEGGGPGLLPVEIAPVVPSPQIYGYRNKMEFGFADKGGETVLGLRTRTSPRSRSWRDTVPLRMCPIFSPLVETLFPVVLEFARENGLSSHVPLENRGTLRHLVLRRARGTGEVMAVLVTADDLSVDLGDLASKVASSVPGLTGFAHAVTGRRSDGVSYENLRLVDGRAFIVEKVLGLSFRIHPQTFFQTNTSAAELLYRRIRESEAFTPKSRVLGLYCGTGPIEIALAGTVEDVTGVDALDENIRCARENLAANGVANVTFRTETAERSLKDPAVGRIDVVVVDPPRAGISAKALARLIALDAPWVVAVSCNPKTLARDLGGFAAGGYRVVSLEPFDFFPHTPHLEILTVLRKI
jgi:23S rRNA (uracil1939-C5)-methyltransferase